MGGMRKALTSIMRGRSRQPVVGGGGLIVLLIAIFGVDPQKITTVSQAGPVNQNRSTGRPPQKSV